MLQHPYVLVSDDAQKNASKVAYSWRMNLPDDMSSPNITIDGADAILTDTLLPGEPRRLLVRMMIHSDPSFRWSISSYNLTIGHKPTMVRVLTGNMTAVEARFRALLFPLRAGEALFEALDGSLVPYDGSLGEVVHPVFINEAAYYYRESGRGVGMSRPVEWPVL